MTLQLLIVVQGIEYPANLRGKDIFEAPKVGDKELFSTHQHEGRRHRRNLKLEASTNNQRIRRDVSNPGWCSDPTKIKKHDISKQLVGLT